MDHFGDTRTHATPSCAPEDFLLHGRYANRTDTERNALLLTFTPDWGRPPGDIRGHLIQHLASSNDDEVERASADPQNVLPRFDGLMYNLPLNRNAPDDFDLYIK